jgi:hypothetical protein
MPDGKPEGGLSQGLLALRNPRQGVHPLDRGSGLSIWQYQMESPKGALKGPARGQPMRKFRLAWPLKRSRNDVPCGVTGQRPVADFPEGYAPGLPPGELALRAPRP